MNQNLQKLEGFLRATLRGVHWTLENPEKAWELLCQHIPRLRNDTYQKIFINYLPYFSRDLHNIDRDWEKL